jgi:1-aminocyclopropane-1-carboxylate deaminase/D-cysteine desulfhydrase-like pyridoxal-dependent ACC family enzyme
MAAKLPLGNWPTPVRRLEPGAELARGAELYLKDDSVTHPLYGGNKVRKLEYLLAQAHVGGASRLLTCGAAGSHHVLATAVFGALAGLRVAAVLGPQPATDHARRVLECSLAWGLEAYPAQSWPGIAAGFAAVWKPGDFLILPGGSSVSGARGYADAARELAAQVARGELPEPDWIVTALGTAGTVAGLVAGLTATPLRTRVLAVSVALEHARVGEALVLSLASPLAPRCSLRELRARFAVDVGELGRGYGYGTARGQSALETAAAVGIRLDPTYTGKAFAAALSAVRHPGIPPRDPAPAIGNMLTSGSPLRVLYWHTLASASLEALEKRGPGRASTASEVRSLLRSD